MPSIYPNGPPHLPVFRAAILHNQDFIITAHGFNLVADKANKQGHPMGDLPCELRVQISQYLYDLVLEDHRSWCDKMSRPEDTYLNRFHCTRNADRSTLARMYAAEHHNVQWTNFFEDSPEYCRWAHSPVTRYITREQGLIEYVIAFNQDTESRHQTLEMNIRLKTLFLVAPWSTGLPSEYPLGAADESPLTIDLISNDHKYVPSRLRLGSSPSSLKSRFWEQDRENYNAGLSKLGLDPFFPEKGPVDFDVP